MKSAPAPQIDQKKRDTLSATYFCPDPRKALGSDDCLYCGRKFKKKRVKHHFCCDDHRYAFWNHQRMDFRAINRKLDIIIERLNEKAVGIKEGR